MATVPVNVDNFVRAETARMFDGGLAMTGGMGRWLHHRVPAPVDSQTVIRMNRDTLYSSALIDISHGATVTMPEAAGRYMTMMIVNEDHYINRVISKPGTYELTVDEFDTPFVALAVRTLVDPVDPEDVATVNALQDGVTVEAVSSNPYSHPDYDEDSRQATFDGLMSLSAGLPDSKRTFGKREDVDPVRHLIGTAFAWGGLPEDEAYYYIESEPQSVGQFTFTITDVPVDAFWSVTIYNSDGFLEANPDDAYSVNNLTAEKGEDGSVTLNLAPSNDGFPNYLYIPNGWNYALRLYRPRPAVLDGTWTPPIPEAVG
jgi:hypothetical protein